MMRLQVKKAGGRWNPAKRLWLEAISKIPVLYRKTLFIIGLSFRLVRNLSGKEGFPTRFTCGNDRVLMLPDVFLRWVLVKYGKIAGTPLEKHM
jgi:hypothetical protein